MPRMQEAVAERLRMTRARLDLSLVEAAERTGVARHTIAALERGKRAPYFPTVEKLSRGYGVPAEWILGIVVEEGSAETPGLRRESREPASVPKSEAPPFAESDERSLSYVNAWSSFVEGLEADIDEWRYAQTSEAGVLDPGDLPDDDFLPFVYRAMPFIHAFDRVSRAVYDPGGLQDLLQAEVDSRGGEVREVERFAAAFRRISRTIQLVVTEKVAQRVNQLAKADEHNVSENVVDLYSGARERSMQPGKGKIYAVG